METINPITESTLAARSKARHVLYNLTSSFVCCIVVCFSFVVKVLLLG